MEAFNKLLDQINTPTSVTKDLSHLYKHCITNIKLKCEFKCGYADETKQFLVNSFCTKPFEIAKILKDLQTAFKYKHDIVLEDIYIESFIHHSDLSNNLYSLLSQSELCHENNLELLTSQIRELISIGRLSRDLVYLCLIPQEDLNVLRRFISYENTNFNEHNDLTFLFRYVLYKNRHWLYYYIENETENNTLKSNSRKINLIKLIYLTDHDLDVNKIDNCVANISKKLMQDPFLHFYTIEIKRILTILKNLQKITILDSKIVFEHSLTNSCLKTLSTFYDLNNLDVCNNLSEILQDNDTYLNLLNKLQGFDEIYLSEYYIYYGFRLILIIIQCIEQGDDQTVPIKTKLLLKATKNIILQCPHVEFQIEIFEKIFTLLFIKYEHLNKGNSTFVCNRKQIYPIIILLNMSLNEIKNKHFSGNINYETSAYRRLCTLIKHVTDAMWRLKFLRTKNLKNIQFISLMLSLPETMIYLCLNEENFEKAHDIIQVFNIQNSEIAHEINYMDRFEYLKCHETSETSVNKALVEFCKENQCVKQNVHSNKRFNCLTPENEPDMNIFDTLLTYAKDYNSCQQFFDAINFKINSSCSYINFYSRVKETFNLLDPQNDLSVMKVLNSADYPLDATKLQEQNNFFSKLKDSYEQFNAALLKDEDGKFNVDHECHDSYLNLMEICSNIENNYMQMLFNYLKLLSKILYVKSDNSDIISKGKNSSFFSMLLENKALLVGKLLFIHNLKPKDLEFLFLKLKLDLVYHIAWNCIPEVDLHSTEENTDDIIINSNMSINECLQKLKTDKVVTLILKRPEISLLDYIRKRNWLLAYLINRIHLVEEAKPDTNSDRTKFFNNLLNLPNVHNLTVLFDNQTITALYYKIEINILIDYLERYIEKTADIDFFHVFTVINSFSEKRLMHENNLRCLRDVVLYNLVSSNQKYSLYVEYITDNNLRVNCILKNVQYWSGTLCVDILKSQLSNLEVCAVDRCNLEKLYNKIELYEEMNNTFSLNSWYEIDLISKENPKKMFLLLLESKKLSLLLQWIEVNKTSFNQCQELIELDYFISIFLENVDLLQVDALLQMLPFPISMSICTNLLKHVQKLDHIEFLVKHLTTSPKLENEYKNITMSLKIMSCFNSSEHEYMMCLISHPLLIIEQLIMNTRLEKLATVLKNLQLDSKSNADISTEDIDNLLRIYAKRALDFRGIQPSNNNKLSELKLMQSLDTASDDAEHKQFIMPEKVPNKKEWVQNEQAAECMCCHYVIFSMFNRRHHCRRCGRVVCGNCSMKKMEVVNYSDIPVRVCNDCYKQSQYDDQSSSVRGEHMSSISGSGNYWLLTNNEKHNNIAREEFSYEYAPSVSLCLSILKLHSNSVEYPRFLLDQCKSLLPMLQGPINEIDYSFIIQMIKTLVTVAKMICLNFSFKTERMCCDGILLQVELLHLLAEHECLKFLPNTEKVKTNDYIDYKVLRRLRDQLLEHEQWSVALDVSMKAGLDSTGVFAAWGKSCLKSGCFQLAREKFQHCLEKNVVLDSLVDVSDMEDSISRSNTFSENRSSKTPPLVNEIIHVLESNSYHINIVKPDRSNINLLAHSIGMRGNMNEPAVCIFNKLKNLNNIANGIYDRPIEVNKNKMKRYIDPIIYEECLYYLLKYGSHTSILQFYIKHYEMNKALKYILENPIQTDVFIDTYMQCLRDGRIESLQGEMQRLDLSLHVWEFYLKNLCRYLEKNSMFNVLYQLQLFMCDYVRAAMTCIKFYKENANNFTELLNREEYLLKSQGHLKQELEEEQWVNVPSVAVHRTSTTSSEISQDKGYGGPFTMKMEPRNIDKHINTIWRQIEVTKLLAECEMENKPTLQILDEIFVYADEEKKNKYNKVPTLFDSQLEKTQLAVLAVVCGKNIEEGFGIAFRIIQDYHLKYLKIYCLAGKYLAKTLQETAVVELISCIRSSGLNDNDVSETCDEVLFISVRALFKACGNGTQLEKLIKLITNAATKISAYIECKQLKCAYLLAVRHNRNNDIKRILQEAENSNQLQIKAICIKRLNQTQ